MPSAESPDVDAAHLLIPVAVEALGAFVLNQQLVLSAEMEHDRCTVGMTRARRVAGAQLGVGDARNHFACTGSKVVSASRLRRHKLVKGVDSFRIGA